MKKLICLCIAPWMLFLLFSQAFAGDFSSMNPSITDFTDELPQALQAAFSGPEWEGHHVEVGQMSRNSWGHIFARVVMQKENERTLCLLEIENGKVKNFVASTVALYPDRVPAFLPGTWLSGDDFFLTYYNQDGTVEKFRFTTWGGEWIVNRYIVEREGTQQLHVVITERTLEFGEVPVFNVSSQTLPEFDISQFPTTLERAQELASIAPEAAPETALTRTMEVPLRQQPATDAPEIATFYEGVPVDLMDGGDANWAQVCIGNLEGYMLREQLAFGIDKANVSPEIGGFGYIAISEPLTSLPMRQQPSSDSSVLADVPAGTDVRVLGITPDQQWVSILYSETYDPYIENDLYAVMDAETLAGALMGFVPADSIFAQLYHDYFPDTIYFDNPHDLLALRAAPSATADLLGEYYNGMTVHYLFASGCPNGWQRVMIGSLIGYVQTENLESFLCGEHSPYLPPLVAVQTTSEGAKLYPSPSETSNPIGIYPEGSGIEVIGVIGEWGHVYTQDGEGGYMRLSALGGKPASAENARFKLISEITLYTDPFDNAQTEDVLEAGMHFTLVEHGFDGWYTPYDYETGYGERQWVDHDWVNIVTDSVVYGYARWSELKLKIEPAPY